MTKALLLLALALTAANAQDTAPARPWYLDTEFLKSPAPAPPRGQVLRASTVEQLYDAAARVSEGGTILLAPGRYVLPRRIEISRDNVSLRGDGDRANVVLDGLGTLSEGISISSCSGVSIEGLTIQNIRWNGIKINSETGVRNLSIRNCVLRDIWQRGVKGTTLPIENREALRPLNGLIEFCLFENSRAKRFEDDADDNAQNFGGNYIAGIDLMFATGWNIRSNVFRGIRGRSGEGRGAIFLWHESRDCVVERNVVIDCDAGICLGNSFRGESPFHGLRMTVRNNFVTRAEQGGIFAAYTRDCRILHNTIFDPDTQLKRLIRVAHDNPGLLIANNLLCGPPLLNEATGPIEQRANITRDVSELLEGPAEGDLRLKVEEQLGTAAPIVESPVLEDIQGYVRPANPTVGASEEW